MESTSTQIKKLRLYLKLTQDEFAEKINFKRNSISMIESGRNNPTFEMIMEINRAFGVSADYFLSDNPPEYYIENNNNINAINNILNDDLNSPVNDDLNRKRAINNIEFDESQNNIEPKELNDYLIKIANSSLLYIDFHLMDIEFNLKLLQEKFNKVAFDRKQYEASIKKINDTCKTMKEVLKSGYASNKALINLIITSDDLIRHVLDRLRALSKDLYLNNYNN